jgi:hypothetical protein
MAVSKFFRKLSMLTYPDLDNKIHIMKISVVILLCFAATFLFGQSTDGILEKIMQSNCSEENLPPRYVATGVLKMNNLTCDMTFAKSGEDYLQLITVRDKLNMTLKNSEGVWQMKPLLGQYNPTKTTDDYRSICDVYNTGGKIKVELKTENELQWSDIPLYKLSFIKTDGYIRAAYFDTRSLELSTHLTYSKLGYYRVTEIEKKFVGGYEIPARQRHVTKDRGVIWKGYYNLTKVTIDPKGIEQLMDVKQYYGVNKVEEKYGTLEEYIMDKVLGLPEDFQKEVMNSSSAGEAITQQTSAECAKVDNSSQRSECGIKTEAHRVICANADNVTIYLWGPEQEKSCDLQFSGDTKRTGYYLARSLDYDKFLHVDLDQAIKLGCKCSD